MVSHPPMPSTHPTSFLIRAAPLTFALLWSSGFIVAKYAAPYADPFTFLSARFGLAAFILVLIAVAMRAPWPASAGGIVHSMVAGMLLHGGYLGGVWWAIFAGLPAAIAGLLTAAPAAADGTAGRATARRARRMAAMGGHRRRLCRHRAGADAATCRRSIRRRWRAWRMPMIVAAAGVVSVTLGTFYQKRFVARTDLRTGTCLQYVGALAVVAPLALC